MRNLDGKIIVLTGGTRGFGLATARACGREGARIVLASRREEAVSDALATLQANAVECTGISCDVSRREDVERLLAHALERYGRVDVWVNNAGTPPPYGPAASVRVADSLATIETNVIGSYYGSITALRYFLPRRAGKLINILGRGDDGRAVPLQAGYAASKAWLRSFTRSLAREYKKSGVGVYAFNPGMMSTEFLTRLEAVEGHDRRLRVMPTIIRMWSNPPEVPAERMVWLASSATDGRTGLELHQMGRVALLAGAAREGWRRLSRRPTTGPDVEVSIVPPEGPV